MQWATTDDLGIKPKSDSETIGFTSLILGLVISPSLVQGTARGIQFTENLKVSSPNMRIQAFSKNS